LLVSKLRRLSRGQLSMGGIGGTAPNCCCGAPSCTTTICASGCPSGAVVGATVTIKQSGTTIATGTTGSNGCVTLSIPAAGTYEVIVTQANFKGFDGQLALVCGGTQTVLLQKLTTSATVLFTIYGCCSKGQVINGLQGATITLSDGQTCTTDVNGQCSFWIGKAGTYSYTVTASRFQDYSSTFTITANCTTTTQSIVVGLLNQAGYACGPESYDKTASFYPIPTTLHLTDSVYGGCVLTYDAANLRWAGTLANASFVSRCGCPAQTFDINYNLLQCYTGIGDIVLSLNWTNGYYGICFNQVFTGQRHNCPYNGVLAGCAGLPNNATTYQSDTNTSFGWSAGVGNNWSITGHLPFSASFTIAPDGPCPGGINGSASLPWPAGGTITITE
jgi:hypothetical protein